MVACALAVDGKGLVIIVGFDAIFDAILAGSDVHGVVVGEDEFDIAAADKGDGTGVADIAIHNIPTCRKRRGTAA